MATRRGENDDGGKRRTRVVVWGAWERNGDRGGRGSGRRGIGHRGGRGWRHSERRRPRCQSWRRRWVRKGSRKSAGIVDVAFILQKDARATKMLRRSRLGRPTLLRDRPFPDSPRILCGAKVGRAETADAAIVFSPVGWVLHAPGGLLGVTKRQGEGGGEPKSDADTLKRIPASRPYDAACEDSGLGFQLKAGAAVLLNR